MSAGDRDTLALLLAEHQYRLPFDSNGQVVCTCTCDRTLRFTDDEEGHTLGELGHRAHVADVIASSDWLREQRAQAWDEGYEGCCEIDREENEAHDYCPNPYRENIESSNNG